MDIEQIIKQVDWLDEERRKDKTRLASFEERLSQSKEMFRRLPTRSRR